MRKRFVYGISAALMLSLAVPTTADAQKLTKSTLSGTLFSASATANNASAPLYTAPATAKGGVPIVTAFCGSLSGATQTITGSTLGELAVTANEDGTCAELDRVGLPLPPGEVLTYNNGGSFDATVTIIGIISKK